MSGAGFDVQPATLQDAAGVFHSLRGSLEQARAELDRALAGCAGMEGDDEYGALFRQYYEPATGEIRRVLGWVVEGLGAIGEGLAAQRDNYAGSDEASAAGISRLRLGEPPR